MRCDCMSRDTSMYAYIYMTLYDNPQKKDRQVKSLSNGNKFSFDLFWDNIYIYIHINPKID